MKKWQVEEYEHEVGSKTFNSMKRKLDYKFQLFPSKNAALVYLGSKGFSRLAFMYSPKMGVIEPWIRRDVVNCSIHELTAYLREEE